MALSIIIVKHREFRFNQENSRYVNRESCYVNRESYPSLHRVQHKLRIIISGKILRRQPLEICTR